MVPDQQHGFRNNRSTITAIKLLNQYVSEALATPKSPLYVIFVDFKKAFDSVNRSIMLCKLKEVGLPGKVIRAIWPIIRIHVNPPSFVRSLRHFGIAENLRPGDENLRHLTVPSRIQNVWQSIVKTQRNFHDFFRHFVSPRVHSVLRLARFFFFRVLHTMFSHLRAHAFALSVTVARSSAVQASSSRRQERRWAIVCGSPQSQSTDWASSR